MSNIQPMTSTDRQLTPEHMVRDHTLKLRDMIQARTDLRLQIDKLQSSLHVVERNIQVHEAVLNALKSS